MAQQTTMKLEPIKFDLSADKRMKELTRAIEKFTDSLLKLNPNISETSEDIFEEESAFVTHARRELTLIGEEPEFIDWYIRVIEEFHSLGHSGGSMFATLPVLIKLLKFQSLSELTDDPNEWFYHDLGEGSCWQNKRDGEAFSNDGGKTYYLLREGGNDSNREPLHESRKVEVDGFI